MTIRCRHCRAESTPMSADDIGRLYVRLAPYLRVFRPSVLHHAEAQRRRAFHAAETRGRPTYVPLICRLFPLHFTNPPGSLQHVVVTWGDKGRPGDMPTYHQFCRAYGLTRRLIHATN